MTQPPFTNPLLGDDFVPAFPFRPVGADGGLAVNSLSLRDYFAAAALPIVFEFIEHSNGPLLAQHAYEIADAMLVERAKRPPAPAAVDPQGDSNTGNSTPRE